MSYYQQPWGGMPPPQAGFMYVPMPLPSKGGKGKGLKGQFKEWLEFQEILKAVENKDGNKKKEEIKKQEATLGQMIHNLIWLLGLSVPVSAFYLYVLIKAFGFKLVMG